MIFNKYLPFLFALLVLSSCAIPGSHNYQVPGLSDEDIAVITDDITTMIVAGNPAKSTRFIVPRDTFGKALASRLGKNGYEVMYPEQNEGTPDNAKLIRYIIDYASPQTLYIALTINNSQRYVRSYSIDRGKLTPDKIRIEGRNDE